VDASAVEWDDLADMMRGRASVLLVTGAMALVLAAGCGLAAGPTATPSVAASPNTTATPATSPTVAVTPTASPSITEVPTVAPFTLASSAFAEGGAIPRANTCDGADRSIPLAWSGTPAGVAAFAIVMDDPDAGGFVHWVVYDMPASTAALAEGASTAAGAPPQGKNGFGRVGYGGPCPPSGTHHYVVRLLALDATLGLTGTPTASAVLSAASGHVLAEARLTGTYKRGG
jgi:Raf kinase inhibitor-like YbhB/YbcL family protein